MHRTELRDKRFSKLCDVLDGIVASESNRDTVVTGQLGDIQISLITAEARTIRKRTNDPSPAEGDICIMAPLSGSVRILQNGHDVTVCRRQTACIDSTRAYTIQSRGATELAVVRFPHRIMGLAPQDTHILTAAPWISARGVSMVANLVITEIAVQLSEFSASELVPLGPLLDGTVRSLLAERLYELGNNGLCTQQQLLLKIKGYARRHLPDPSLSPRTLAAEHNISLRYLQKLFSEQGETPARWLRTQRLERCRAALSNPRLDHLTVAAIGASWGLGDGSQLGRLFRQAYGVLPSELRRRDRAARRA